MHNLSRLFIVSCAAIAALSGCAASSEEIGASGEATDGATQEARASLTGKYEATSMNGWGNFDKLELKQGGYYTATSTMMCITMPCPPHTESGRFVLTLPGRGLKGTLTLAPDNVHRTSYPIEIGKDGFTLQNPNGIGEATFAREKPACVVGGCGGERCIEQGAASVSPCIAKPEFACYPKFGVCERNAETGACGWRKTEELQACLANLPRN